MPSASRSGAWNWYRKKNASTKNDGQITLSKLVEPMVEDDERLSISAGSNSGCTSATAYRIDARAFASAGAAPCGGGGDGDACAGNAGATTRNAASTATAARCMCRSVA